MDRNTNKKENDGCLRIDLPNGWKSTAVQLDLCPFSVLTTNNSWYEQSIKSNNGYIWIDMGYPILYPILPKVSNDDHK